MACFSAEGTLGVVAAAGTAATILYVYAQASPTRRAKLYELNAGTKGAGWDDFAASWLVRRGTAVGAGADAVTPVALDPADGAATWAALENYVAGTDTEPTYASTLLSYSHALRLPVKWQAIQPGREIIAPATQNNGTGISINKSGGVFVDDADACFLWEE